MPRPARPSSRLLADPSAIRALCEAAERVFLQMRVVRDAARHLTEDIDRFEDLLRELQAEATAAVNPSPTPAMPPTVERSTEPRILRIADIQRQLGLGHATIYRLMQRGGFPAQMRLSDHAVGWKTVDVEAWLATREVARQSRRRGKW
jgi:prophage regulatory protein